MAEKIKFHLDENVENAVAQGLKRRGIDVTTTHNNFQSNKRFDFNLGIIRAI